MKNRIKFSAVLIAMSLITSGFNVHAANGIPQNDSKSVIVEDVKSFVDTYEAIDISDEEKLIFIENKSSKRANDEDISYINMMSLLLERNNIIQESSESDITEYSKEIDIKYDDINITDNEASVNVTVTKTWNYSFSDIESGAVDNYQFEFVYEDGDWKIDNIGGISNIVTDFRLQKMGDQISVAQKDEYLSEIKDEKEQVDANDSNIAPVVSSTLAYSSASSTRYALDYALNPNPNYADFTNLGGDCTNFISQCLYAGGKSMHYGTAYSGSCWYYTTSTNRSSTWTGASQFRNYVTSGNSQLNMSTSNWNNVVNGDIIQLMSSGSAYHSLIITGVAYSSYGRSDILVCAHTTNRRHVSLSAYYSGTKAYYHVN